MSVDADTKQLLVRWHALLQAEALQRAKSTALALRVISFIAVLFVVIAIAKELDTRLIAVGAVATGWLIAEGNALRTRIAQWLTFKTYLDWQRIEKDLQDSA